VKDWITLTFCLKVEKMKSHGFMKELSSKCLPFESIRLKFKNYFHGLHHFVSYWWLKFSGCSDVIEKFQGNVFRMLHFTMILLPGSFKWEIKINSRKNILISLKYFRIGPLVKMLEISTYFVRLQWGPYCAKKPHLFLGVKLTQASNSLLKRLLGTVRSHTSLP